MAAALSNELISCLSHKYVPVRSGYFTAASVATLRPVGWLTFVSYCSVYTLPLIAGRAIVLDTHSAIVCLQLNINGTLPSELCVI